MRNRFRKAGTKTNGTENRDLSRNRKLPALPWRNNESTVDIQLHSFAGRNVASDGACQLARPYLLFKLVVYLAGDRRLRTPCIRNRATYLDHYPRVQEKAYNLPHWNELPGGRIAACRGVIRHENSVWIPLLRTCDK